MYELKWSEAPKGLEFTCPACCAIQKERAGIIYTYEGNKKEWLGRCGSCGSVVLVTIRRVPDKITTKAYAAIEEAKI